MTNLRTFLKKLVAVPLAAISVIGLGRKRPMPETISSVPMICYSVEYLAELRKAEGVSFYGD